MDGSVIVLPPALRDGLQARLEFIDRESPLRCLRWSARPSGVPVGVRGGAQALEGVYQLGRSGGSECYLRAGSQP